jgi:uncharacterized coiled-coil DUF342 family protein
MSTQTMSDEHQETYKSMIKSCEELESMRELTKKLGGSLSDETQDKMDSIDDDLKRLRQIAEEYRAACELEFNKKNGSVD